MRGCNAKSSRAPSPKRLCNPDEDARPQTPLPNACITPARAPPEVGVQRGGGDVPGSRVPRGGGGGVWSGAGSSKDRLPGVALSSSSRVRKVAGGPRGRTGTPKRRKSHLETVSCSGAPVRSRNRRGTGLWRERGWASGGGAGDQRTKRAQSLPGEEGGGGSAHPPGPTLSGSSSCSAGRGREIAAASTSRPLRAAQPGDRRRSRSMRCARDGRPGGVRGRTAPPRLGPGSAQLRHLLPPQPLRLTPGSGSGSRRRRRRLTAPRPGPGPAPAPRANQARHRPLRHRPARPTAPRPKFGASTAPVCRAVDARDRCRLVLLLASGDPPGPHLESKGLNWGKGTPRTRPSGEKGGSKFKRTIFQLQSNLNPSCRPSCSTTYVGKLSTWPGEDSSGVFWPESVCDES